MKTLPAGIRNRVLLRSFAVQGSWNYETLIGTGFGYTLLPALRYIYRDRPTELRDALARHVELFNSHPYFSTVAVGAVARLEAEGVDPQVIQRFKTALRGSLGSLGDRLIWTAWRPMTVLLSLVLVLAGASWWLAVAFFLVLYNSMHLGIRVHGLSAGLESGLDVGRVLRDAPIQLVIERSGQFACVLVGAGVVLAGASGFADPLHLLSAVAALALGLWLGPRMRRAMVLTLAGVTILALFLGLAGYGA